MLEFALGHERSRCREKEPTPPKNDKMSESMYFFYIYVEATHIYLPGGHHCISIPLSFHDGGNEIESNNQSKPQLVNPAVRDSAAPNVHKHKAHSRPKKIRANPESHSDYLTALTRARHL